MMQSTPSLPHQRGDVLEVNIMETINLPNRKDGHARRPAFRGAVAKRYPHIKSPLPPRRRRKDSPSSKSTDSLMAIPEVSSSTTKNKLKFVYLNETFSIDVTKRLDYTVKIQFWDQRPSSSSEKLLGECRLPLEYIGREWVDAKLKLHPSNHLNDNHNQHNPSPNKFIDTFVHARLRFTTPQPPAGLGSTASGFRSRPRVLLRSRSGSDVHRMDEVTISEGEDTSVDEEEVVEEEEEGDIDHDADVEVEEPEVVVAAEKKGKLHSISTRKLRQLLSSTSETHYCRTHKAKHHGDDDGKIIRMQSEPDPDTAPPSSPTTKAKKPTKEEKTPGKKQKKHFLTYRRNRKSISFETIPEFGPEDPPSILLSLPH